MLYDVYSGDVFTKKEYVYIYIYRVFDGHYLGTSETLCHRRDISKTEATSELISEILLF